MKRLMLISLIVVGCNSPSPTQDASIQSTEAVDARSMSEDPVVVMEELRVTLKKTNDVFEGCIMPQHGLYAETQTCDNPPTTCDAKEQWRCPCAGE